MGAAGWAALPCLIGWPIGQYAAVAGRGWRGGEVNSINGPWQTGLTQNWVSLSDRAKCLTLRSGENKTLQTESRSLGW